MNIQRRVAIALALCLTTILGFATVALGSSAGMFNWTSNGGDSKTPLVLGADSWWWDNAQGPAPAPVAQPQATTAPAPSRPAPKVVIEYVYIDQYVPAASEATSAPAATPHPALSAPILPAPATAPVSSSPAPSTGSPPLVSSAPVASTSGPKPSNGSTATAEEGLKGTVLQVYGNGSFLLATKYGDLLIRTNNDTQVKPGTAIEEGALLKTKVEVIAGTYTSPSSDGSFSATSVSQDVPR